MENTKIIPVEEKEKPQLEEVTPMKISIEEARKIYMDSLQIHLDFPLKRRTYNLSPAFQEKIKGTTVFDFASNSKEESRSIMDAVNRNNLIRDISYYQDLKYFGVDKADVYIIGDDLELHHELAFSSGYSWIGVKVDDKICAVSASDYVCKRPAPETQLQPFILLKIAVAEMLGVSGDGPRRMLPRTAHYIPIAVVSAAPSGGLTGLNEEEFEGAQRAIELIRDFFKKKLKNGLSFSSLSYQEIEQLALCALSYLMGGKFCPNKTMVQSLADMGLADWDLPLCPVKICSWGGGADGQIRGINEKDVTEAFNSLQPRSHL